MASVILRPPRVHNEPKGQELAEVPKRLLLHPKGPRLLYDDGAINARVIFHEDKKERAALKKLVKLYQRRVERISRLVQRDFGGGVRVFISTPSEYQLEALEQPLRRGAKREKIVLPEDRVQLMGTVESLFSTQVYTSGETDRTIASELIGHVHDACTALQRCVDVLSADVVMYPKEWKPLPTLGEFMEQEAKARRRGRKGGGK